MITFANFGCKGTIFWADMQINTLAYAVMRGLWCSRAQSLASFLMSDFLSRVTALFSF